MTSMSANQLHANIKFLSSNAPQDQKMHAWNNALNLMIKDHPFYVFYSNGTPIIWGNGQDSSSLVMPILTIPEEAVALPGPTAGAELRQITLSAVEQFLQTAPYVNGLMINPGTQDVILQRQILDEMLQHRAAQSGSNVEPRTVKAGEEPTIHMPSSYPHELLAALSQQAQKHPTVRRMWLRELHSAREISHLVIVEVPETHRAAAFEDFGEVLGSVKSLTMPVDFMTLTPDVRLPGNNDPFYRAYA
ncbi:MAG: enhanced serine sensitivity protein SseB [Actinomycetaceae bacterium]|nr:enhanced serine sensitivity protein SseB [Actinomycetaceae bacterium]